MLHSSKMILFQTCFFSKVYVYFVYFEMHIHNNRDRLLLRFRLLLPAPTSSFSNVEREFTCARAPSKRAKETRFYWKERSPCLIFLLLCWPTSEERSLLTIKVLSSSSPGFGQGTLHVSGFLCLLPMCSFRMWIWAKVQTNIFEIAIPFTLLQKRPPLMKKL